MNNPNGPYPGRQLFLGLTAEDKPCFAYLITGRSPESRERKAVIIGDIVRIGPTGNQPYDALRHYSAIKLDNTTGIAAISNGIQTEAIFETYKLLFNVGYLPGQDFMEKILDGAGAEPDSYHTPRIAAVIINSGVKAGPLFFLGMKANNKPAKATKVQVQPGNLIGISTYTGDMEKPVARDPEDILPGLEFKGKNANDLANFLFDISAASNQRNDIRVCSVGGVRTGNQWELSIKNVH